MKNLLNLRNAVWFALSITGTVVLQSCVVYRPYPESQLLKVPDIVQMSKDGTSSKDIISEIQKSHTAYNLKADQLVKLHDQGVPDSVINYMEETKMDLIQRNQRYSYASNWAMYDGFFYGGLGWGWPYGFYGWGWGPAIIYSVNRGFGGGSHGNFGFHGVGHGMRR